MHAPYKSGNLLVLVLTLFLVAPFTVAENYGWYRHKTTLSKQLKAASVLHISGEQTQVDVKQETNSPWLQVEVKITSRSNERLDQVKFVAEPGDNIWHLSIVWPGGEAKSGDSAHIEVTTPALSELNIQASNAQIGLQGVHANTTELRTSNAKVKVDEHAGKLQAVTANASIDLKGHKDGAVELLTSNGMISAEMTSGMLYARTSNGRINANLQSIGNRDTTTLVTSNAQVHLTTAPSLEGRIEINTSNGGVSLSNFGGVAGTALGPNGGYVQFGKDEQVRVKITTSNASVRIKGVKPSSNY